MGVTLALLAAALLGSATIVALSRHLALADSARDFTPPSFIAIGDEP